jgi:hypothetical protein
MDEKIENETQEPENFTFNSDALDENTEKPQNFDENIRESVPEPTRRDIFQPIAPNSKIVSITHLANLQARSDKKHQKRKLHKKMAKDSRRKNRR